MAFAVIEQHGITKSVWVVITSLNFAAEIVRFFSRFANTPFCQDFQFRDGKCGHTRCDEARCHPVQLLVLRIFIRTNDVVSLFRLIECPVECRLCVAE
jgi:hypothetical protein